MKIIIIFKLLKTNHRATFFLKLAIIFLNNYHKVCANHLDCNNKIKIIYKKMTTSRLNIILKRQLTTAIIKDSILASIANHLQIFKFQILL
jgi:hypothetical protein